MYRHDKQGANLSLHLKMLRTLSLNIILNTIMKKFLLGLFFAVTCLLVTPNVSSAASKVSKPVQVVHKVTEKKVIMGTLKDLAGISSESVLSVKQIVQKDILIIVIETECCIIIIVVAV